MEDNYRLLCAYKRDLDVSARNQLIMRNQNLIHYVYNHFFWGYTVDEDTHQDMLSAGVVGLIDAINSFDVDRYETLSTYAVPYIRDRMAKVLTQDIPFSSFENEESDASMEEQIEGDYSRDDNRYSAYEFLSKVCTNSELDVIGVINRTCDEPYWSVNEIAKELHISASQVRHLYKSAVEKLNQPWVQWYLYNCKGVFADDKT